MSAVYVDDTCFWLVVVCRLSNVDCTILCRLPVFAVDGCCWFLVVDYSVVGYWVVGYSVVGYSVVGYSVVGYSAGVYPAAGYSAVGYWLSASFVAQFFHCRCPSLLVTCLFLSFGKHNEEDDIIPSS